MEIEYMITDNGEPEPAGVKPGDPPPALAATPVLVASDPEVVEKAKRRSFRGDFKARILEEADRCKQPGEVGALLRRHGLYSSHLTMWRRERQAGTVAILGPKKRGRKVPPLNPLARRVTDLERENQRLLRKLKQAEAIIDVQKKLSEILGITLPPTPPDASEA